MVNKQENGKTVHEDISILHTQGTNKNMKRQRNVDHQ
jgi:hypothetical protein